MNVITVSREYGAGGGEVARRLAEALGWELLDHALLHQAAAVEHVPDAELERLDEKALSMADRFRLHPPHQKYIHGITEAARQAAARGNAILVGRGTRHLLGLGHRRGVAHGPGTSSTWGSTTLMVRGAVAAGLVHSSARHPRLDALPSRYANCRLRNAISSVEPKRFQPNDLAYRPLQSHGDKHSRRARRDRVLSGIDLGGSRRV